MAPTGPIYVDLDDVLSETIGPLTRLLADEWGREVAVEEVQHFDLGRSFGLEPGELDDFMRRAHEPDFLEAFPPRDGAAQVLGDWHQRGYHVAVMTGRPPTSTGSSRTWLDRHGMVHASFACVDKYARQHWAEPTEPADPADPALPKAALGGFGFSLAVEDSLDMASHLAEECGVPVALMDRPWNRDLSQLSGTTRSRIVRCTSWAEVAERFSSP